MRLFPLFCSLSLAFTSLYGSYTVVEDTSQLNIKTPSLSERKTAKIRLENGLEAFIISDPGAPESGAALSVGVGSWDEPGNRPGMAHFVEHLLFLGTEKYPEEAGYTRFLDEHGGERNAFTANDKTVYMFSVKNAGFDEAFDRFSQFFVAPIFSPSGVEREMKAIDQEFCKDVPIDAWRFLHVLMELGNPQHPFHRFSIGNKETLANISQDELKEWYRTHYSAHLMRLVVISPLPLETLQGMVSERLSSVKSFPVEQTPIKAPLFSPKTASTLVAIAPFQEIQTLEILWEIPASYARDQEVHSDAVLSHILGHEGRGSLLSELKHEGLAEGLSSSSQNLNKESALFCLSIDLTAQGLKQHEAVIERCFQALAGIREWGVPKYLYDEVVNLAELNYAYQSRQEVFKYVTKLVTALNDESLETFPRKSIMPSRYDEEQVRGLACLLTPVNARYNLIADPKLTRLAPTAKERWMSVEYTTVQIDEGKIAGWAKAQPSAEISLPAPNHFLPENLKLVESAKHEGLLPIPTALETSVKGTFYYCPDSSFQVPEIHWTFRLKTPGITDASPKSALLADLFCHALKERLNPIAYEAKMAGLDYSLAPSQGSLELKLKGYSDKAPLFLQTILGQLKGFSPTAEEFASMKELFRREYRNKGHESPLKEGKEMLCSVLYKEYASLDDKEKALQRVSLKDFNAFKDILWKQSYVEGMLYGNLSKEEASSVVKLFNEEFKSLPFPADRHFKRKLAAFDNFQNPSCLSLKSEQPGHAVILTADCGEFSFKRRAAQEILSKGLEEPFFSELRTKQQTAYLVTNWSQEIERRLYCFFAVQSSSYAPRDLLARFELFLENSLHNLTTSVIPESRFNAIKASLLKTLEEPAHTLGTMGTLLFNLAFDYEGDFSWYAKRIDAMKDLTYAEFCASAGEFLGPENRKRLAICVDGDENESAGLRYQAMSSLQKIREEILYKGK